MAPLSITIDHQLTEEEALKRIKKLLAETEKEHGDLVDNLEERWTGNEGVFSFTAKGQAIKGILTVSAPTVTLAGELPWAMSMFKGKIEKMVTARAKEVLS